MASFAGRAFRRPVTPKEVEQYLGFVDVVRKTSQGYMITPAALVPFSGPARDEHGGEKFHARVLGTAHHLLAVFGVIGKVKVGVRVDKRHDEASGISSRTRLPLPS